MILIIASVAAGIAVAVLFAAAMMWGRQESLGKRIGKYQQAPDEDQQVILQSGNQQMSETQVVQKAVEVTELLARKYGLFGRVENMLQQAEVPLLPAEALFFYLAGLFLIGLASFVLTRNIFTVLIAILIAGAIPPSILIQRRRSRLAKFEEQLPEVFKLLASTLRSGFSLMQGLEHLSKEVQEPGKKEFQQIFNEARLGRSAEDAMQDAAERMESLDLAWAVMAVRIQHEVGGNLAELLDTVAETMVSRDQLRREIKSLTAEGRFSGVILGIFPFAMAGILFVIKPDYIGVLLHRTIGIIALSASAAMSVAGFLWIRKIMAIEV